MLDTDKISEHFTVAEYKCKCGCGICNVDPILALKVEHLRKRLGRKLSVNSGCRCKIYNEKVGGSKGSYHIASKTRASRAVDIHAPTGQERGEIVAAALSLGFTGIGVDNGYIHLDIGHDLKTIWAYPLKGRSAKVK